MDGATEDFNPLLFEKKLTSLKDTQDSIQHLSTWCLKQRQHHKKIVASWLNVLKRVKVEQRLTLFYLANDVIQYSKRKSYEFVESWGTTLQKATPLVRDDKVKHRILRIFKIWEQRAVYDEEFLTDLTGLLSAGAGKRAPDDDPNDFQPSLLVNKIKQCSVLEADTDLRLKHIHECHLSMSDADALCANLKVLSDKRNSDEVQKELDDAIGRMERYTAALQREIVARETLCALLTTATNYYDTQRGEVKVVANAYKNFGARVRGLKRKLDELIETLPRKPKEVSPVPSPPTVSPPVTPPRAEDVPSPGPEEDLELPRDEEAYNLEKTFSASILSDGSMFGSGFSSFLGSTNPFNFYQDSQEKISKVTDLITGDISKGDDSQGSKTDFNINEFFKSMNSDPIPNNNNNKNGNNYGGVPPPPPPISVYSPPLVPAPRQTNTNIPLLGSNNNDILPGLELLTPTSDIGGVPVPSFYGSHLHNTPTEQADSYNSHHNSWNNNAWESPPALGVPPRDIQQDIPSPICLDTPESPPPHDRKAEKNIQPIITIDSTSVKTSISDIDHRLHSEPPPLDMDHRLQPIVSQVTDIDHRGLLPPPPIPPSLFPLSGDMDHRSLPPTSVPPPSVNQNAHHSHRNQNQDIDHRNLISLTAPSHNQPPARPSQTIDQDYRLPPPPMPPSMSTTPMMHQMPLGNNPSDIVESVDMDLSEDEDMRSDMHFGMQHTPNFSLPPPPPFQQYGQPRNMPHLSEEEPMRPTNRQFNGNNKVLMDASEEKCPAPNAYRETRNLVAVEREPEPSPPPEKHEPLLPALDAPFDFDQLARPQTPQRRGPVEGPAGPSGPVRPQGPAGPMRPQGSTGPGGPLRPQGPMGAVRPQGSAGPMGAMRAQTPAAPAGRGEFVPMEARPPPYSGPPSGWRPPMNRTEGPRPFGFAPFRYPPPRGARGLRRPMRPQRGFW